MKKINYIKISDYRYRENPGLYYDDFIIGEIFEHRPGRTITEVDNIWLSLLFLNPHPLHIDSQYGSNTEFKKNLVNSVITFSIINGMSVSSMSFNAIANLGWDNVKIIHPVYVGDTLLAESEVIGKRESESRKNQGIVTIHTKGYNQDKIIILEYERTFLIPVVSGEVERSYCDELDEMTTARV